MSHRPALSLDDFDSMFAPLEDQRDDRPDVGPTDRDRRELEEAQARLRELILADGQTNTGNRWLLDAAADEIVRLRNDRDDDKAALAGAHAELIRLRGEAQMAREALERARAKVEELRAEREKRLNVQLNAQRMLFEQDRAVSAARDHGAAEMRERAAKALEELCQSTNAAGVAVVGWGHATRAIRALPLDGAPTAAPGLTDDERAYLRRHGYDEHAGTWQHLLVGPAYDPAKPEDLAELRCNIAEHRELDKAELSAEDAETLRAGTWRTLDDGRWVGPIAGAVFDPREAMGLRVLREKAAELRTLKTPAAAHGAPGKATGDEATAAGHDSVAEEQGAAQELACECPPDVPAHDRCDRTWTRCNARLRALRPELAPQDPSPKRDVSEPTDLDRIEALSAELTTSLTRAADTSEPTARDAVAGMLLRLGWWSVGIRLAEGKAEPAAVIAQIKSANPARDTDAACIAALEAMARDDLRVFVSRWNDGGAILDAFEARDTATREALGARDDECTQDAAERVVAERDRERADHISAADVLREVGLILETGLGRTYADAARDRMKERLCALRDVGRRERERDEARAEAATLREQIDRMRALGRVGPPGGATKSWRGIKYRVEPSDFTPGAWVTEAYQDGREELYGARFYGDDAEERAHEYAAWVSASVPPSGGPGGGEPRETSETASVTETPDPVTGAPRYTNTAERAVEPAMRIEKRADGEYLVGAPATCDGCDDEHASGETCCHHLSGEHLSVSWNNNNGAEKILARWPIAESAPARDAESSRIAIPGAGDLHLFSVEPASRVDVIVPKALDPRAALAIVAVLLGLPPPEYEIARAEAQATERGVEEGERRAKAKAAELVTSWLAERADFSAAANDERAALKAGKTSRFMLGFIDGCMAKVGLCIGEIRAAFGIMPTGSPDGGPGGGERIPTVPGQPAADWTYSPEGAAHGSTAFRAAANTVLCCMRERAHDIANGSADYVARLIVARLAYDHGLAPRNAQSAEEKPVAAPDREALGRAVHEVWLDKRQNATGKRPELTFEDLDDDLREHDRNIGERLFAMGVQRGASLIKSWQEVARSQRKLNALINELDRCWVILGEEREKRYAGSIYQAVLALLANEADRDADVKTVHPMGVDRVHLDPGEALAVYVCSREDCDRVGKRVYRTELQGDGWCEVCGRKLERLNDMIRAVRAGDVVFERRADSDEALRERITAHLRARAAPPESPTGGAGVSPEVLAHALAAELFSTVLGHVDVPDARQDGLKDEMQAAAKSLLSRFATAPPRCSPVLLLGQDRAADNGPGHEPGCGADSGPRGRSLVCTAHFRGEHLATGMEGRVYRRWPIAPASPEAPDLRWEPGAVWELLGVRYPLCTALPSECPEWVRFVGLLADVRVSDMTEANGWRFVPAKPAQVKTGQVWRCVGVESELTVARDDGPGRVAFIGGNVGSARIVDMLGLKEWTFVRGPR